MRGIVAVTTTRRLAGVLAGLMLLALASASAQQSVSFQLEEHVFNAGGNPDGGVILTSANFQITLDSIGEGVAMTGLSSASFQMEGSFGSAYPPPGEVSVMRFLDNLTLAWDPERSAGIYNLYRDFASSLPGAFGMCEQQDLPGATATDTPRPPLVGDAYFYLATVENRLLEEGTKGFQTSETERQGTVCP